MSKPPQLERRVPSPLLRLPLDILKLVMTFACCSPCATARLAEVCSEFRNASCSDSVWRGWCAWAAARLPTGIRVCGQPNHFALSSPSPASSSSSAFPPTSPPTSTGRRWHACFLSLYSPCAACTGALLPPTFPPLAHLSPLVSPPEEGNRLALEAFRSACRRRSFILYLFQGKQPIKCSLYASRKGGEPSLFLKKAKPRDGEVAAKPFQPTAPFTEDSSGWLESYASKEQLARRVSPGGDLAQASLGVYQGCTGVSHIQQVVRVTRHCFYRFWRRSSGGGRLGGGSSRGDQAFSDDLQKELEKVPLELHLPGNVLLTKKMSTLWTHKQQAQLQAQAKEKKGKQPAGVWLDSSDWGFLHEEECLQWLAEQQATLDSSDGRPRPIDCFGLRNGEAVAGSAVVSGSSQERESGRWTESEEEGQGADGWEYPAAWWAELQTCSTSIGDILSAKHRWTDKSLENFDQM